MRNRHWGRDELIVALDGYCSLESETPSPSRPEVGEVYRTLKLLSELTEDGGENSRSVASVVMKMMNFRSLDESYVGVGLRASGKADRKVWNEFADDRERLGLTAKAIRYAVDEGNSKTVLREATINEATEGSLLTRIHVTRERSRLLVFRKKSAVLATMGCLACEACGFDFNEIYGRRGHGFIECHHTKPVHTLKPRDVTRIGDLALLCANCHRMIHARQPWLEVDELRSLIQRHSEP